MKPLSKFHQDKRGRDGYTTECLTCKSIRRRAQYEKNREHEAATHRKYNIENRRSETARKRQYRKENHEQVLTYSRAYSRSVAGVAARMRNDHGYSLAESKLLAKMLHDATSVCAICGIPNWLVRLNHKKGGPFFLGHAQQHTRLHPDRIDTKLPHSLINTRLLCPTCNIRRGAETYSDSEVLQWVRARWLSIFSPRMLWWMNTEPGKGGRQRRNPNAH